MDAEKNFESQIPLILYRLDTTAQVLEEVKLILDKQTQNLTSLLVLQEKHNNLQAQVNVLKDNHAKELEDIKLSLKKDMENITNTLSKAKQEIDNQKSFMEKFYGGLYVALFVFSIFQASIVWWINNNNTQIKSITDNLSVTSNKVLVLETEKQNQIILGKKK